MKNITDRTLLAIKLVIDGVPLSTVREHWNFSDKDFEGITISSAKITIEDNPYGAKAIEKEIERRGLQTILPVLTHPERIILQRIDISQKMKSKSKLTLPNGSENDAKNMELYSEHPLQATVVGIGSRVKFPGLAYGSRVYLTESPREVMIYNETMYYLAPAYLIACLVFK